MLLDRKLYFYYDRDFHFQFQSYELGSQSTVVVDAGENKYFQAYFQ